jgi:hypothetical protein
MIAHKLEALALTLDNQLIVVQNEPNIITRCEKALLLLTPRLTEIRAQLETVDSADLSLLIHLYKNILPPVYAEYLYYGSLHNLESNKPLGSAVNDYYSKALVPIEAYLADNADFLKYYRSGKTHLDAEYFVGGTPVPGMFIELYSPFMLDPFCTTYSFQAAKGLAYEKLQNYITELTGPDTASGDTGQDLYWTHSKTDLIELVYALHSGGVFNKGTASIASIARFFEGVLNIQLGNTSMTFQEILRRKDSTAFLDRLKKKLEEHITNIDEKKFR